jgi:hypothetical protein
MEALPRFEQILALGRKLVDELDMETSVDTLGRWMAHYVAELMDAAENAPSQERVVAQKRCSDAILELWSHRAELPDGKRPFENLEPIIRAVESLDPDDKIPRYFRIVRGGIVEEDEESKTKSLLEFVSNLDSTARTLIGYTLVEAARSAADKSKEWVTLAEDAGAELRGAHSIVLRFVSGETDSEKKPDPNKLEREMLQDHINRLETFTKVAVRSCENLKERLDALPKP